MANTEVSTLAARYATAALNAWKEPLSMSVCTLLEQIILFYKKNQSLFFFLQAPLFSHKEKKEALVTVRLHYGLPFFFDELNALLLAHKRIAILGLVYTQLIKQSYKRMGIVPCDISTAVPLSVVQQEMCTLFVQKICAGKPLIRWHVNPSLIAGISIQTAEGLWEYSLDARLRVIANTVLI